MGLWLRAGPPAALRKFLPVLAPHKQLRDRRPPPSLVYKTEYMMTVSTNEASVPNSPANKEHTAPGGAPRSTILPLCPDGKATTMAGKRVAEEASTGSLAPPIYLLAPKFLTPVTMATYLL